MPRGEDGCGSFKLALIHHRKVMLRIGGGRFGELQSPNLQQLLQMYLSPMRNLPPFPLKATVEKE